MSASGEELVWPLPATPEATRLARRAIGSQLPQLPFDVVDDVLLIVSELVNNAVQHGQPEIELRCRVQPVAVDVSVLDHGTSFPAQRPPQADLAATSGRGLAIIDTLANAWGVEPLPQGDGKRVWATLHHDGVAPTGTGD